MRYLVLKKEQGAGEIYCRNGRLIFESDKSMVLRDGVAELWSLGNMKKDMVMLYQTDKNEFFAGVVSEGKLKSEKMLFGNRKPLSCLLAWGENGLKLFVTEKINDKAEITKMTISPSGAERKVICRTNIFEDNMRLFSSEDMSVCVYRTKKGLELTDCNTDEVFEVADDVKDYSVCMKDGKIYCLCATNNGVSLYTTDDGLKKIEVFKGGADECVAAIVEEKLYAAAKSDKKIYVRSCDINNMKFSPMGSFPAGEKMYKKSAVSDVICCCEFFDNMDTAEIFKKLTPRKKEDKAVKAKKEDERNIFNEALVRNIEDMSAQNSMLNLRARTIHEKLTTQINGLKEEIIRLESENERLKQEKDVLKKAKKLLEEEIYRLNCLQDSDDEYKVIDNDEKN